MSTIPVIVVHGGAGAHNMIQANPAYKQLKSDGIKATARAGYAVLKRGGTAVDAAVAAVAYMEDCPVFNAGVGSTFTRDGVVEMDASVMDGSTLEMGAVGGIQNILNPVKVAKLLVKVEDCILLGGVEAKKYALAHGFKEVPQEQLLVPTMVEMYERYKKSPETIDREPPRAVDTVGAVAIDNQGNVAYANSTGGMMGKRTGRIGDTPLPGCGGYADNTIGATATTGKGESFMRTCLGYHALTLVKQGKSMQEALEESLQYMGSRVGGFGGMIGVTREGQIGISFNTQAMSWAYVRGDEATLHWGIYKGDQFTEKI